MKNRTYVFYDSKNDQIFTGTFVWTYLDEIVVLGDL